MKIFDASINYNSLTGRNLAFLQEHLEHIAQRLTDTVEETIDFADLVVLAHSNQCYVEALRELPGKGILDLSGSFLKQTDLSEQRLSIILAMDLREIHG